MSTTNTTNEEQYTCDFCGGEAGGEDLIPPDYEVQAAWCDDCEERLFAQYRFHGKQQGERVDWLREGF